MFEFEICLLSSVYSFTWQLQHIIPLVSIFITVIHVKNGFCVIPEASQEGGLRSFKSYEDVAIFHYDVPTQLLRATWQFAGFADNKNCPQRKINIFLKQGSYPVISLNNATNPAHSYIDYNNTIQISTVIANDPTSMAIVPVYSPEAGDWFVAAYLSPRDEGIHLKGLRHQCHYSLGSVAVWTEATGIENIPLDYQKTIKTSDTISYYKIYIPMETWSFQVDVWGCNFTLKNLPKSNEPCIKNLALKGRVLPYHNHSNPSYVGNLTSFDTYTFSESSPYQDSWYYLMVVSTSPINFLIKVTTLNCPILTIEESFIQRYADVPLYSKSNRLNLNNLKEQLMQFYTFNKNQNQQKSITSENDNNSRTCFPRYQLVRIKNADSFSRSYLLRGKERLTSWLGLTDNYPIYTQFKILPLVDIGGTLDIQINLEINEILSKQDVNVNICISRGRIPNQESGHLICDNRNMMMQLSTNSLSNASLLIPYPQPDVWYIAFQTTCYMNGMPVHCEMEVILVFLRIKLQSCIFEGSNSCGKHGICQEIHKGSLFYTACKCIGGRQGWGCTDIPDSVSELSILLKTLALTLSNLFFIPAICLAIKRKLYAEALIYFSTMMFSGLYHACDQQLINYCIVKYDVLQYCDFFLAILAFWVTLVAMADVPVQYVPFYHMLGAVIITFGVESDKTGIVSSSIPLLIGLLIPLSSYGYYCFKAKRIAKPRRAIKLIIGIMLAIFGILLFSLVETEANYQYVHSFWHVVIALSLIFLLPPVKDYRIVNNKSTNELDNYKESPDNSVFNIVNNQRSNHLITDIS